MILLILFIKTGKKRTKSREKRRKIRKGICFFFFVNTLSVAVFIWTGQERPVKDGKLGRDEKGGGSRNETVLATVDGICERVPVQIRVDEQGYTEEEVTAILKEVSEELEAKILGSNEKGAMLRRIWILSHPFRAIRSRSNGHWTIMITWDWMEL